MSWWRHSSASRLHAARVGLTFFEFNTLAALLVFEAAALDAWVLEIGMGGRLDAVNVVDPDVAVVVSIGFDHQEYLGTTLEAIAREKAGIFRKQRPAVLGSRDMPGIVEETARDDGRAAQAIGARVSPTPIDTALALPRYSLGPAPFAGAGAAGATSQYANAATAIAALEEIDPWRTIPAGGDSARNRGDAARRALSGHRARTAGRADVDPGRRAQSGRRARAGAQFARSPTATRTLAVCGILADKDAEGIAAELHGCIDAWWCVSTEGERGRNGADLAQADWPPGHGACRSRGQPRPPDAPRHWPMPSRRIESSCLDPSTRWDRRLIGSRRTDLLPRAEVPEYTAAHLSLRLTSSMDRRVKERLVGASILVVLIVLIVPELLSGPAPPVPATARLPVRLPASAPEPRNVIVDLGNGKAQATPPASDSIADTAASAPSPAATAPAMAPAAAPAGGEPGRVEYRRACNRPCGA